MMSYLAYEVKLSAPWWLLLLSVLMGILRLTKAFSPEVPDMWRGWVSFLESFYPALFPLLMFEVLKQEKRWRTYEVMVSTPKRKGLIFLVRAILFVVLLVVSVFIAVRPAEYLAITAPGIFLAGITLCLGLFCGEEIGLGTGLGWWGLSFAIAIARRPLSGFLSWFMLVISGSGLSQGELLARKWAQLGVGLFLFSLVFVLADYKRSQLT